MKRMILLAVMVLGIMSAMAQTTYLAEIQYQSDYPSDAEEWTEWVERTQNTLIEIVLREDGNTSFIFNPGKRNEVVFKCISSVSREGTNGAGETYTAYRMIALVGKTYAEVEYFDFDNEDLNKTLVFHFDDEISLRYAINLLGRK